MVETPKWPELARGHKGTNVKALQLLLRFRGANISVDGDFGTNTYNAVLNFQKNNGLRYKDGVAGEETLSAMIVTIKSRTINDAAWAAQTLLNKFENLTVDSDFWTGSEKATHDFQTKMGFTASNITGTVTPITWRYLFGYDAYPSGGSITPGNDGNIQGNKDYRGQSILTDSQIALLNANKRFYQSAAATYLLIGNVQMDNFNLTVRQRGVWLRIHKGSNLSLPFFFGQQGKVIPINFQHLFPCH